MSDVHRPSPQVTQQCYVQVVFTSIPEEPATRVQFNNNVVNACQVSVGSWDALSKQEQKATEKKRKASNMETGQDDAKEAIRHVATLALETASQETRLQAKDSLSGSKPKAPKHIKRLTRGCCQCFILL